nr:threonine aldolase [Deltaproteobacteria bacterium]
VDGIKPHMHGFGVEHHAQPKVVSITQATELGTVYRSEEIAELSKFVHENGMLLHMDGARLANAAVFLDSELCAITKDVGVDVLSFGGTKNGIMVGEAIVFLNPELARDFKYLRKQGMQLASKMRFISVQFDALLSNDLWRKNAAHANRMAERLSREVEKLPGIQITQPVEANGIFVKVPQDKIPVMQSERFFYVWNEENSEVRWMTSFDTTEEDILSFVDFLKKNLT